MHKIKTEITWLMGIILLLATNAYAGEIIKPLGETDVKAFISRLNNQGIIINGLKNDSKKNEVFGYDKEYSSFGIADTGVGWYLYKVDINNDKEYEYVLCSVGGSGGFFGIDYIYQYQDSKLVDIFNQIKIPMRKLIRDAEKENYDLEEGYVGFMNGCIKLEKDNGKVYFTMVQITRDYPPDKDHFYHDPQGWKFLWDNGSIKLVNYYVRNKVDKF